MVQRWSIVEEADETAEPHQPTHPGHITLHLRRHDRKCSPEERGETRRGDVEILV
jgi:hypothetical protein